VLGGLWGGWTGALGGFLLAGVARVVCVQHMTFFINSLCHTIGDRPYSSRCTARDSMLMALFTFGEGYHNFHHEFQHDYRNGVKPWQFDPTKWTVWLLHRAGMVDQLRRVPEERILLAEIAEKQRQVTLHLNAQPDSAQGHSLLESAHERLQAAARDWEQCKKAYRIATQERLAASREKLGELKRDMELASQQMREALEHWRATYQMLLQQYQLATQSIG
jgi:stearoyl-CoA desaturase (Delta-9 desaturase)